MANQEESKDGIPRKDADRPSPAQRNTIDPQSGVAREAPDASAGERESSLPRSGEEKGSLSGEDPAGTDYRGDGPGKVGLTSDKQRDLVSPSGVNERDHGAADDKPMAGGSVNLDDDDMVHPRGNTAGQGGTWKAKGGDSAPLGPPREVLSDRNGPSDPDNRKK